MSPSSLFSPSFSLSEPPAFSAMADGMRCGAEFGESAKGSYREDGGRTTAKHQSSEMAADEDLRWVPPWSLKVMYGLKPRPSLPISVRSSWVVDSRCGCGGSPLAGGRSAAEPQHKTHQQLMGHPGALKEEKSPINPFRSAIRGSLDDLRKSEVAQNPKVTEQRNSMVSIVRFLIYGVSHLVKFQLFRTYGPLGLRFEIRRMNPFDSGAFMLNLNIWPEHLAPNMAWFDSCICVIYNVSVLVSGNHGSIYINHGDYILLALVWKGWEWERAKMTVICPLIRKFESSSSGNAWPKVYCRGRGVSYLSGQRIKECALDRKLKNIILGVFSRKVCSDLYGRNMSLFSGLISTVHLWAKHVPNQCVWKDCSALDWSCGSFFNSLFDYADSDVMIIVVLLEHLIAQRKLCRNHSYICVPREANSVARWSAEASLAGSCLLNWVFRPFAQLQAYLNMSVEAASTLLLCLFAFAEHLKSCISSVFVSLWCLFLFQYAWIVSIWTLYLILF